eukprot:3529468-Alexandrium_andersonii.AAC.1
MLLKALLSFSCCPYGAARGSLALATGRACKVAPPPKGRAMQSHYLSSDYICNERRNQVRNEGLSSISS